MDRNKLLPLIGLILLFSIFILKQYLKDTDIKNNELHTKGKVVKLLTKYRAGYSLIYEYYVNNIKYISSVGVDSFNCDDGTKCCIGSEFNIYYSSKNPENSRIDLGKYEKYKTTVEFFK
jgi:hypothetical protein